jgi:hypothetical protein
MKIKKSTIKKAMAATAAELNLQCLRMAIERTEEAQARAAEALIASIQKLAGQRRELAKQEAICAARRAQ